MAEDLPLVAPAGAAPPRERADAARNRRRILEVARELLAHQGAEAVGMDAVARAACVGTGTLYRRFGDRAGLMLALLDDREREFQEALLHGPPPLGPGAPPRERLHAFGRSFLALQEGHSELLLAAVGAGPLVGGPFESYRLHLRVLLEQAGFTGDSDYAVSSLLAMLTPGLVLHLRERRGWSEQRLADGFCALADSWLGQDQ